MMLATGQGMIVYTGERVHVATEHRMMMLYRVIAGFASISFAFYAVSQMVLADASVIVFTSPVITFFLVRCSPIFLAAWQ